MHDWLHKEKPGNETPVFSGLWVARTPDLSDVNDTPGIPQRFLVRKSSLHVPPSVGAFLGLGVRLGVTFRLDPWASRAPRDGAPPCASVRITPEEATPLSAARKINVRTSLLPDTVAAVAARNRDRVVVIVSDTLTDSSAHRARHSAFTRMPNSYEITDGVLKIHALSRPKPVLIITSLQRVIRIEDWDVSSEPLVGSA